ncbi:MAG: CocE/NonD family hydrolase, partial [bacterium]
AGQGSQYLLPFVLARSNYDATWERLNLESRFDVVNVPIYHMGGWHDIFTEGTINGFVGLQHNGAEGARSKQKLLVGPWTHANWFERKQGELTFPSNSMLTINDYLTEKLRWFDYWLQGKDTQIMSEPPVRYYVMGAIEDGAPGNEWRTAKDWPLPAQPTPFYFHDDGDLTTEKSATATAARSYQYDPKNPVPTKGGRNLQIDAGPYDQSSTENRPDVLVFTTPVLAQPLEVIGKIIVKLWISSSAKDTDFMAKLTDVYPDGRSMLIGDGALRARHRYSLRQENFMTPDSVYECEVDLWSTAIIFNRGHRIRVAISSSNAPRFDPNPNTGRPLRADSVTVVATNTVHLDANYPSHIVLPVTSGTTTVSATDQRETAPKEFVLGQNFPNPVASATQISYSLSRTAAIRITLFNLLGQEVRTLVDGLVPSGVHTVSWDGRNENGQPVAKGIYFYRLEAGGFSMAKKLIKFHGLER